MTWSRLTLKMLFFKPLGNMLSVLLLAAGVGIIALVTSLGAAIDQTFKKNIRGFDMVVGAKGSPLQLILAAIYHMDAPTGNISLQEAREIGKHPMVEKAIPLSFGDNYNGFRIVGTETSYPEHYQATLATGKWWHTSMEVVLGATAAARTGLQLGATFYGSHGLGEAIHVHEEAAYTVVGILQPTGTVVDQLVLTALESVWDIHADPHGTDPHDHHAATHGTDPHDHHADTHGTDLHEHAEIPKEITALLVKFRNPMAIMQLPRMVNSQTNLQAALPAIEINRLFGLLGIGIDTLRLVAFFLMALAGFSVFISLYNTLKENVLELAIIRAMGASRWRIFALLQGMGLIISSLGLALGIALAFLGKGLLANFAQEALLENHQYWDLITDNWLLFPFIFGLTVLAALVPAIQAYRMNISKILARES